LSHLITINCQRITGTTYLFTCHGTPSPTSWGFLEVNGYRSATAPENGNEVCAVFFSSEKHSIPSLMHWDLMITSFAGLTIILPVSNGFISDPVPVLSGVPQGSGLGPLIFLIYTDDLPPVVSNLYSSVNLFADDVLLYHLITDTMGYAMVQEAIKLLEDWSITNHPNFNVCKCQYMIICRRNSPTLPLSQLYLLRDPLQNSL